MKVVTMTDSIRTYIENIREIVSQLHQNYQNEVEKNNIHLAEIKELQSKLAQLENVKQEYHQRIENLSIELESTKNQVILNEKLSKGRTADEINELVKEMEYCILQLKDRA